MVVFRFIFQNQSEIVRMCQSKREIEIMEPHGYNLKETRKSITYNYMLYKGVVVSKINNHYSIVYLGLTN